MEIDTTPDSESADRIVHGTAIIVCAIMVLGMVGFPLASWHAHSAASDAAMRSHGQPMPLVAHDTALALAHRR